MAEPRAKKYGRMLAALVNYTIQSVPGDHESYRKKLVDALLAYSFEPKRNGEPANNGCVYELEGIVNLNVENPEELAKLVKEGIHLMYQKQTAARVMSSLLENLAQ